MRAAASAYGTIIWGIRDAKDRQEQRARQGTGECGDPVAPRMRRRDIYSTRV
jgi:hypothetical protein